MQKQTAKRKAVSAEGETQEFDRGAVLRSARQGDFVRRVRRETEVKRKLERIESVTAWLVIGAWWVMFALGVGMVGVFVFSIATAPAGTGMPDWAARVLSFGVVGLVVDAVLAIGLYLMGEWLHARLRRWAADQGIDPNPLAPKTRSRRKASAKDSPCSR